MSEVTPDELRELADKQAITDVLHRYCRAVDRMDWESLAAVYWDDAIDHHGVVDGHPSLLIDWLKDNLGAGKLFEWMNHSLSNVLIEVTGDSARVESYFSATQQRNADDGKWDDLLNGRYVDRFERRNGEWRVAERYCLYDWSHVLPAQEPMWKSGLEGGVFHSSQPAPHDLIYSDAPALSSS